MMDRKPIFEVVRAMVGRHAPRWGGFSAAEVKDLDRSIDAMLGIEEAPLPVPRTIGQDGINLIKSFEGCRLNAYPDPGTGGDPWTIGWGATHMDGRKVRRGDSITQERADKLLEQHLQSYAAEVAQALDGAPTSQKQFDALVSFHFNTGKIRSATLTKRHKAGDYAGAAYEFDKWTRAGGHVMKGLARRRAAERALYEAGS